MANHLRGPHLLGNVRAQGLLRSGLCRRAHGSLRGLSSLGALHQDGRMLGARGYNKGSQGSFSNPQRNSKDKLSFSLLTDGTKMLSLTETVALFQKAHPAEKTRIHRSSLDISEFNTCKSDCEDRITDLQHFGGLIKGEAKHIYIDFARYYCSEFGSASFELLFQNGKTKRKKTKRNLRVSPEL